MEQNTKNLSKNFVSKIPKEVSYVTNVLEKAGFEAYLVGGCIRDLLMEIEPKDWDITTNAKPEQIIGLFEKTIYENTFGTVGVVVLRETPKDKVSQETSDLNLIIEVTPYRIEGKYSDFRHPEEIKFSNKLEDDLKRRDFTANAVALNSNGHVIDMFDGIKDIKDKMLKTVGESDDRFKEDALRMLRAVRFACQLDFSVSYETTESILKNAELIKKISEERIRDEFVKIITSANASSGVVMLHRFGLLKHIIPELEEGIGCEQLGEHIYDVWDHLLHAVQHAANKNWSLEIRLAALFHDIGKPRTRRLAESVLTKNSGAFALGDKKTGDPRRVEFLSGQTSKNNSARKKYTFYGHEVVGAKMAKKIMERLKFSKKEIELVDKLVRNHMFFSDTELITLSAVRRIIAKVGTENIWLLMNVRECDRVGMKKKEAPYRLRKYFAMIEEAMRDPISVGQLKIDGEFMIKELGIKPGPRMGWILHALLEEVLDNPEKNTVENLSKLVKSLDKLNNTELKALGDKGKEKKEELEEEEISKLREKHGVRKK
ncbi:MAG: Polynucleotide adenylyltransferase/metal dependent phosphohydrolase [Candidatus Yanofskybacteria bacterium GW2011_GWC2_37_9]|uniref:Polynucleotide adenylyltransferase/metal dependent phosphohydrolase n=1 Tax=Candidatus Yanofskybacteria bacterium GW2011_GWC2_37_9 TaxID=1619028 RepID=A0A0G0HYH6_9BACT|nr:MAG: Polynucleotide adenylyltransferase/metal dependent phosphohydrolase [Candidatus Yanofskybacteria bacterium GW2011_GWC2_37_9]